MSAAGTAPGGIWLQTVSASSAQTAFGALSVPSTFAGNFQVLLVNPTGATGSPALGGVDTTRPWAAIMESAPPGTWSATGGVACQTVANVPSWGFSGTTRPGAAVAWVDVSCPDGSRFGSYHVEWDFLALPAAGGTAYPEWGDLDRMWGYMEFGQVSMVEATMKVCGVPAGATSAPWTCASSNEPDQVYLSADKFSSVTMNLPLLGL